MVEEFEEFRYFCILHLIDFWFEITRNFYILHFFEIWALEFGTWNLGLGISSNFVKSITRNKTPSTETTSADVVSEPVEEYNWINPSRPSTDEEFKQLVIEMEQDLEENSSKDVINFVKKELKAWRKKQK